MLRKIATSALVSVLWKCFALLTVFILVPPPIVAKECGNVSGSDTPTKTIRRTAPLIPGSNLIVTNPVGSIQLSGWEREQIIVEARIEGEKPDSVEIDFKKVNAGIEVVIKNISTRRLLGLMPPKKVKCDLIISVPRQILIRVKAINGQIKISDINGSTKCETVNGGIQMLNIFGDIDASTVNGSISLSKANLRPRIVIRRPPGQPPPPPPHTATIKLETVNGTIQMDEVVGGIVANTIHGAIRANMLFGLGKDINLESISGNLTIENLHGRSQVTAESIVGVIEIKTPNSQVKKETKTSVVATIPGTPNQLQKISLKTVNGKITVQ